MAAPPNPAPAVPWWRRARPRHRGGSCPSPSRDRRGVWQCGAAAARRPGWDVGARNEPQCRCQPRSVRGAQGSHRATSARWSAPRLAIQTRVHFPREIAGAQGQPRNSHWPPWTLCKALRGVQSCAEPGGRREGAVPHHGRSGQEQEREQMCHGESHAFPFSGLWAQPEPTLRVEWGDTFAGRFCCAVSPWPCERVRGGRAATLGSGGKMSRSVECDSGDRDSFPIAYCSKTCWDLWWCEAKTMGQLMGSRSLACFLLLFTDCHDLQGGNANSQPCFSGHGNVVKMPPRGRDRALSSEAAFCLCAPFIH